MKLLLVCPDIEARPQSWGRSGNIGNDAGCTIVHDDGAATNLAGLRCDSLPCRWLPELAMPAVLMESSPLAELGLACQATLGLAAVPLPVSCPLPPCTVDNWVKLDRQLDLHGRRTSCSLLPCMIRLGFMLHILPIRLASLNHGPAHPRPVQAVVR